MLVLHPSTRMLIAGPPEGATVGLAGVAVKVDGPMGLGVKVGKAVSVTDAVGLATPGVAVALVTPMMTGVPVKIEGVCVKGRNGVGGLPGSG
jgi:hypothetical protein